MYINFKKEQLSDLSISKEKEYILVNERGSYSSSSISTCNTRKYHGLLIAYQPLVDLNLHILLGNIDETIVNKEGEVSLAVHQYPGTHHPKGYLLLKEFEYETAPKWIFETEKFTIEKEFILCKKEDRLLVKYTIRKMAELSVLRLQAFLAFRDINSVRRADFNIPCNEEAVAGGIKLSTYSNYSPLYFQASKPMEFKASPDWYHNIEYVKEVERGYDFSESLFVPGNFDIPIKEGDELIFSAGTTEANAKSLVKDFEKERANYIPLNNYENCLHNAAEQFIVKQGDLTEIIAGWFWFGRWGRDTFISLPGLTLATNQLKTFEAVVDSIIKDLKNGLFPNNGVGEQVAYNSADAPLCFVWALQQYAIQTGEVKNVWKKYGALITSVLLNYKEGTQHGIRMMENGLVYAGEMNKALTWMDAIVDGIPVTPRSGMAVEINAMWYNAICFALEAAEKSSDEKFIKDWGNLPALIEKSFTDTFWSEEKGYLADYVNGDYKDWAIRPNQIFALSMPYSIPDKKMAAAIVKVVEDELLTPRGLRTLSAKNNGYTGIYTGNQNQRDHAYHNGTIWPWLLEHFAEACLKVKGAEAIEQIEKIYNGFEPAVFEFGLGTIAEIYNADAPYTAVGTISQAWSIAALLRMKQMVDNHRQKKEPGKAKMILTNDNNEGALN